MRERPILMSAPMVRALLAGTKTQTRRVVKCSSPIAAVGSAADWERWKAHPQMANPDIVLLGGDGRPFAIPCPYGRTGDRLWVKEAFRFPSSLDALSPAEVGEKALGAGYSKEWAPTLYEADGARTSTWSSFHTPPTDAVPGRYRHARFMPRWASRITLDITGVRVERLQAISPDDAIAEGARCWICDGAIDGTSENDCACFHSKSAAVTSYRSLWESINGVDSWDLNPWVWAIEFKRLP